MWTRSRRLILIVATGIGLVLPALQACGAKAMEMNVVVFNYWPRPLADVYVNKMHVGAGYGAFGPGGTGSKISCCFEVKPGRIRLEWILDGPLSDSLTGSKRDAEVELSNVGTGHDYLGVYLYPDGTAAVTTSRGIPDDRKR
jgi:hypothetical protein